MSFSTIVTMFIIIVAFIIVLVAWSLHFLKQNERGVIETLGKYSKTTGPGLVLLVPFIQKMEKVNMEEQSMNVAFEEYPTKDSVYKNIGVELSYQIADPYKAVYGSANKLDREISNIIREKLEPLVYQFNSGDIPAMRAEIDRKLKESLEDSVEKNGVKFLRVRIQF